MNETLINANYGSCTRISMFLASNNHEFVALYSFKTYDCNRDAQTPYFALRKTPKLSDVSYKTAVRGEKWHVFLVSRIFPKIRSFF